MTAPARAQTLLMISGGALVLHPAVPSAAALAMGAALALTIGNPLAVQTRALAKRLLPMSVVALGAGMNLVAVLRAGARGIGFTVVSIGAALVAGMLLARALDVDRVTGVLVTVGTAICGGSAIAAVAPVVRADDRQLSVALATVFLLNAVALLVFPPIGHLVGLDPGAFGLWAALAIHDTSSVVGAALQFGPVALSIATTIKLARALWIVPVALGVGMATRTRDAGAVTARAPFPWFIVGFLALAALTTFLPALRPAGALAAAVGQRALVLTLFLIGLGLSREALRTVGLRPLVLGAALWGIVATGSLAAVILGVRAG